MREKIRDLIRDLYDIVDSYNKQIDTTENEVVRAVAIGVKQQTLGIIQSLERIIKPKKSH